MEPTQQSSLSWVKWLVIAVAVVVVGSGAWYAWGYFAAKGSIDAVRDATVTEGTSTAEIISQLRGDTNGDGKVTKDEIQQSNPLEAAKIDTEYLLKAYAQDFDDWREDSFKFLYKYMTPEQREVVKMPGLTDKSQLSDQEVANIVSIDIADASMQQDKPEEGQRMLPLVIDPGCEGFETFFKMVPMEGMIIAAYRQVGPELERIKSKSFMGIDLTNTEQARIIKQEILPGIGDDPTIRKQQYGLYTLNTVNGHSSWKIVQKWDDDNSELLDAIRPYR
ncbi:hypothetical protein KXD97_17560 [Mycobacterium sp. SMC-8]|uniref:hypothetical protein n=1 Tax=Mycobacterium sp. SMC-8 TaxID=2857060 RepID=UPI0021B4C6C0|nr:hypothetical protein [Mycobacterium sp. SMC-8]UXA09995.1 hypothetical protein KXD97_17560 [Mycobacterium sp. SMC-8]